MNIVERYKNRFYINENELELVYPYKYRGKGRKEAIEFMAAYIHYYFEGEICPTKQAIISYILKNKNEIYNSELYKYEVNRYNRRAVEATIANKSILLLMQLEKLITDLDMIDEILLLALKSRKWRTIREKLSVR